MGGTSKTSQTQSSQLAPYSEAAGPMNGILGQISNLAPSAGTLTPGQSGALNTIESNAAAGTKTFAPTIQSGALGLLNGGGANNNNGAITQNLGDYKGLLESTANGSNMGANSALKPQLDAMAADITNNVNGSWAAAGRDGSPGNSQALGRGIATGLAPVVAGQYNTDNANRLNAAGSLYGAGNTTYGILNGNQQTANTNFTNGIGAAGQSIDASNYGANGALQAAAQRFGIPASQLTTLLGAVSPVAAQFGKQSGTSTGESQMSGAQQFALLANGFGSMMPKAPITFGG